MALVDCEQVTIDYSDPNVQATTKTVEDVIKQCGPKLRHLILKNAEHKIFPVKIVDAHLRKHPEKVKNVTRVKLQFDPCNSVQLLKMVRCRFPKVERLDINYSDSHPIEQALSQVSQMPNLIHLVFPFRIKELYEFTQTHSIAPFTKMEILTCGKASHTDDNYDYFEATIPVLFPNLVELDFSCPSKAFADRVEQNVKRLLPKLERCQALDVEDCLDKKSSYKVYIERDTCNRKLLYSSDSSDSD